MDPYEKMIGQLNKLNFKDTTSLPDGVVRYANDWEINWSNLLAIQRVYETSDLLGRAPDLLGKKPGQMAVWYYPKSKVGENSYYKFEIRDVAYRHTKPAVHSDFFFVTIRMKLKPDKISQLNKITSSAYYYGVGQLLTSVCHSIEPAIATFSVIKDFNNDKINLEEARQLYDIRVLDLLKEFTAAERCGDLLNYPTPMRDILEEYILADLPKEEYFTLSDECGCSREELGEIEELEPLGEEELANFEESMINLTDLLMSAENDDFEEIEVAEVEELEPLGEEELANFEESMINLTDLEVAEVEMTPLLSETLEELEPLDTSLLIKPTEVTLVKEQPEEILGVSRIILPKLSRANLSNGSSVLPAIGSPQKCREEMLSTSILKLPSASISRSPQKDREEMLSTSILNLPTDNRSISAISIPGVPETQTFIGSPRARAPRSNLSGTRVVYSAGKRPSIRRYGL